MRQSAVWRRKGDGVPGYSCREEQATVETRRTVAVKCKCARAKCFVWTEVSGMKCIAAYLLQMATVTMAVRPGRYGRIG
jgi:hypothetical protein